MLTNLASHPPVRLSWKVDGAVWIPCLHNFELDGEVFKVGKLGELPASHANIFVCA